MLNKTNSSLGSKNLYETKEQLFDELKSLVPSVNIKAEVLTNEERIKSLEDMVNLSFLIRLDEKAALCKDFMSSMTSKMKKCKKSGIASVLNGNLDFKQPSKGKIYGRNFNGRFASKAVYRKHQMKGNNIIAEAVQNAQKLTKKGDLLVECGITWSRVDQVQTLKALEALRLPVAPSQGSKTKELEEFSDLEPEPRQGDQFGYDDGPDSCPPLPLPRSGVTCGMDFCRLGCVCHSIRGSQKKLLKRDHCSQYQCMFSCHCQHLTRSRATVFENLSPIMDSKFSFTKLNKSSATTKKQLFLSKASTEAEDSSGEMSKNHNGNKSVDAVRKSKDEVENNKRNKRKIKKKAKTNVVSENSSKNTSVVDCLEISSSSEDEAPLTKKKKSEDLPIGKSRCDGFEAPMLFPAGKFYMEHVLIKKRSESDGSRQDLLVESYHDFDWQNVKKSLSGLIHENTFTKDGINRERKNVEWGAYRIHMFPAKEKKTIPRNVLERLDNPDFEYIKAIVTKAMLSPKEMVKKSPVKISEPKPAKASSDLTPRCASKKCEEVIVVEDDSEVSDSSEDHNIINKVGSLAPRLDDPIPSSLCMNNNNNNNNNDDGMNKIDDKIDKKDEDKNGHNSSNIVCKSSSLHLPAELDESPQKGVLPTCLGDISESPEKVSSTPEIVPKSPTERDTSRKEESANQAHVSSSRLSPIDQTPRPPLMGILPSLLSDVASSSPLQVANPTNLSPVAISSPILKVPFHNATGISGCRQFRFNAIKPSLLVDSQKKSPKKVLSLRNSNLTNSTKVLKVDTAPSSNLNNCSVPIKDHSKAQPNDKLPTKNHTGLLGSRPILQLQCRQLPTFNGIKILRMPSVNSSKPLNVTQIRLQSIVTTPKSNKSVVPPPIRPPVASEKEGKKIIVLKHVPNPLSNKLFAPSGSLLRPPTLAVTPVLQRLPVAVSLKQLPGPLAMNPNLVSLLSKVDVESPKPKEIHNPSAIEVPDSDEEEKNKKANNPLTQDASLANDGKKDSESCGQVNGSVAENQTENNTDSKSVSSHSDVGADDHQVCRKRLKLLYQEIAKMENSGEKLDKISAGDILDKVLATIRNLQDTNVELANLRLVESETRKKLVNKIKEIKGDTESR